MIWHRSSYGRYTSPLGDVIERTSNLTALRRWYIVGGISAYRGGLGGGFFRLAAAKAAVEAAHASAEPGEGADDSRHS